MIDSENQGHTRSRLVKVMAAGIAICLLSSILLLGVPSSGTSLGTRSCVGVVTSPSLQIGFAWASPLSSYLPPLMFSKYKVCVDLPMSLSSKTINGEWMLPP